jgi:non-specific serine/threonine protein kinase
LSLISDGYTNREIARKLSLSLDTIKWYNKQLFSKLGVSSRTQATAVAREYGLLDAQPSPPVGEQALPKHNLPHIPTSFIGRQHEIAEIKRLLQTSDLVVLTGAGGSGKTRLALQVATEIVGNFPDGAWFVDLSPLSDPELVPNALATTLGVSQQGESALMEKIKHFLQPKRLLLVLDNFEHLLVASPLVGELITSAPYISILATSREKLNVYGEQEYPVQPLALPNLEHVTSQEQLMQFESISLFVDRARAVKQDFRLHSDEIPALARVVVHLDGLPLALELAASRIKMFSLATLDERLSNRLSLLTGGARDLPERQRTLRDTIDWSYNLLDTDERRLFERLSVFQGGRSIDAAETVCNSDLSFTVLNGLESLLNKNLLFSKEGKTGETRFYMLETIHEYARERLALSGETDNLKIRHALYFLALAERAEAELHGIS